jgi:LacI family transcriptional regulator
MVRPPLTTVRVPMAKMGSAAIDLLCKRVAEPERETEKLSLPSELVVRESCGCGEG